MKVILTQNGLKKALEVESKKSDSMTDEKWMELNEKALSAIQLCLSKEVVHETTAAGLWLKLESLYMTKSLANKLRLKERLYMLRMAEVAIFVSFTFAAMYGIVVAALRILSTIATGLAIDAYGPISDNARGIAEMAGISHQIRERTDASTRSVKELMLLMQPETPLLLLERDLPLDPLHLCPWPFFGVFVSRAAISIVYVLTPKVFIGLIVGAMFLYWFSAMTMKSVGSITLKMVEKVHTSENPADMLTKSLHVAKFKHCLNLVGVLSI